VNTIEKALGHIAGGSVLDVGTQEGGFVQILKENLQSYTELVGIDKNERSISTASKSLREDNIRFLVMNAEQMDFEDEHFDTVSISASLHHLANIPRVLGEMKRVLKPGGHFIIIEMHRDGQTEAELTSIYLHHWVAEIDSALDRLHNSTFARQEFMDYAESLELHNIEFYDFCDRDSDPMDKARVEQLESLIERINQRATGVDNAKELKMRGTALRQRLHMVGAQREPILLIIGKKRER